MWVAAEPAAAWERTGDRRLTPRPQLAPGASDGGPSRLGLPRCCNRTALERQRRRRRCWRWRGCADSAADARLYRRGGAVRVRVDLRGAGAGAGAGAAGGGLGAAAQLGPAAARRAAGERRHVRRRRRAAAPARRRRGRPRGARRHRAVLAARRRARQREGAPRHGSSKASGLPFRAGRLRRRVLPTYGSAHLPCRGVCAGRGVHAGRCSAAACDQLPARYCSASGLLWACAGTVDICQIDRLRLPPALPGGLPALACQAPRSLPLAGGVTRESASGGGARHAGAQR